jgi:hypothetical protein
MGMMGVSRRRLVLHTCMMGGGPSLFSIEKGWNKQSDVATML